MAKLVGDILALAAVTWGMVALLAAIRATTLPEAAPPVKKKPAGSLAAFRRSRGLASA